MTDENEEIKGQKTSDEEVRSFKDAAPDVQERLNREQEVAASIAGEFSNRFFVFVSGDFVKISFLEVPSPKSDAINPQSSVVLSIHDAQELHKLLGVMVRPERDGQVGTAT